MRHTVVILFFLGIVSISCSESETNSLIKNTNTEQKAHQQASGLHALFKSIESLFALAKDDLKQPQLSGPFSDEHHEDYYFLNNGLIKKDTNLGDLKTQLYDHAKTYLDENYGNSIRSYLKGKQGKALDEKYIKLVRKLYVVLLAMGMQENPKNQSWNGDSGFFLSYDKGKNRHSNRNAHNFGFFNMNFLQLQAMEEEYTKKFKKSLINKLFTDLKTELVNSQEKLNTSQQGPTASEVTAASVPEPDDGQEKYQSLIDELIPKIPEARAEVRIQSTSHASQDSVQGDKLYSFLEILNQQPNIAEVRYIVTVLAIEGLIQASLNSERVIDKNDENQETTKYSGIEYFLVEHRGGSTALKDYKNKGYNVDSLSSTYKDFVKGMQWLMQDIYAPYELVEEKQLAAYCEKDIDSNDHRLEGEKLDQDMPDDLEIICGKSVYKGKFKNI
tara:strand:- start:958 stop:2289 length:1332 start_codon:yes stop_codon:yes gene_type:complete